MKQNISFLILVISLLIASQATAQVQDTLVLVKQSRIDFCNSKIEQVNILSTRLLNKDAEVVILNNLVATKELEITSFKREQIVFNTELELERSKTGLITEQNKALESEVKQLRKKSAVKTIAIYSLIGLIVGVEVLKAVN